MKTKKTIELESLIMMTLIINITTMDGSMKKEIWDKVKLLIKMKMDWLNWKELKALRLSSPTIKIITNNSMMKNKHVIFV